MPTQGMWGPYLLDEASINEVVPMAGPGVYALANIDMSGALSIGYVGHSDRSVADRLRRWARDSAYCLFLFAPTDSARTAYEAECALFHEHTPPGNATHPVCPGRSWPCPCCGIRRALVVACDEDEVSVQCA